MLATTAVLIAVPVWGQLPQAQIPSARPLSVEDALQTRSFVQEMPPSVSPNGTFIAVTLRDDWRRTAEDPDERFHWFSRSGVSTFAGNGCGVFLINAHTGKVTCLSGPVGTAWNPVWSPNGKQIAFYSDRDGAARLWIWERETGVAHRASPLIVRPLFNREAPQWTPNGKQVLCKVLPYQWTLADAAATLAAPTTPHITKSGIAQVTVYESRPVTSATGKDADNQNAARPDGETRALTNRMRADLALISVRDGTAVRIVRNTYPYGYCLSPDGKQCAYTTNSRAELLPGNNRFDLVVTEVLNIKTNRERVVSQVAQTWWGDTVSWSPNGTQLSWVSFGEKETRCHFFDMLTSGETAVVLPAPGLDTRAAPIWAASSDKTYLLAGGRVWEAMPKNKAGREVASLPNARPLFLQMMPPGLGTQGFALLVHARETLPHGDGLYRVDPQTGRVTPLHTAPARFDFVHTCDNSVFFVSERADVPPDLWRLALDEGAANVPRRVTRINPRLEAGTLGKAQLVEWESDGAKHETLRGVLLLPAGYTPGKRVPLVVRVYGGARLSARLHAWGSWGTGAENAQLFATRGFAVLLPDIPMDYKRALQDIPDAVLPGVDKVVAMGIADTNRVGVIGHSQGGYTAMALLVAAPLRFRAVAVVSGFGSLFGTYGVLRGDGEAGDTAFRELRLGGTPWQTRDIYVVNSPTFFLDCARAPVLLIHGGADRTVPPFLADELFVGLRRLNQSVEYARYEGEGHAPERWSEASRRDYAERVLRWFTLNLTLSAH